MFVRKGTYDEWIPQAVGTDYREAPERFAEGDVVLDVGCHIGSFSLLMAGRGARVVGYEANRENYALASVNTRSAPLVRLRNAAVWRSDVPAGSALFVPSIEGPNTGGGAVMYASVADATTVQLARGEQSRALPEATNGPTSHAVPTIGLDAVLEELGRVRLLKLDVEGSEYPILLTATRLDQVELIVGEYHVVTPEEMALLAPAARVGDRPYSRELLGRTLEAAGFDVTFRPEIEVPERGMFSARR